jgi:DNA-binding transcriptional LysR family regulator
MEIGQLEALVAVAREGSFTLASRRLDISQPSLSARIRALESSLGRQLIDRKSRPVRLTPLGEAFLSYAERALAILSAAEEMVRLDQMQTAEKLLVGCPFSVATYLMPEVVDRFSQAFPDAELFIDTGNSDYVVSQLEDGLVNLAFAAAFPKFLTHNWTLLLLHDEMSVAVSPRHPLANIGTIRISEIWANRVLLIHWGPAFHAYVESLRQMSHNPGPLVQLPLAGALPMARNPDTVTFMPRRLITTSGLVEVQITDFSFSWDIALMTRPGRLLTYLEQQFVDIVSAVWQSSEPPT